MAKGDKKLKKYPKKPKGTASLEVMSRYIQRCKDIDKENAEITKHNKLRETKKKEIAKISGR